MAIGHPRATLDNLYLEPGKAELVEGRIVHLMPTGRRPNRVAGRIFRSLDEYTERTGVGEAYTDNMGFTVPELPSGRESFSPDAAFFSGPFTDPPMRFIQGTPDFAVEVRIEHDYGPAAEEDMAEKRDDYFAAGTKVVWDVDPVADCIHVYRATDSKQATTYRRGQEAEAEPAVAGWKVSVDWIFGGTP